MNCPICGTPYDRPPDNTELINMDMLRALRVITLTPATKAWLERHDPKALEQCNSAIAPCKDIPSRPAIPSQNSEPKPPESAGPTIPTYYGRRPVMSFKEFRASPMFKEPGRCYIVASDYNSVVAQWEPSNQKWYLPAIWGRTEIGDLDTIGGNYVKTLRPL